MATRTWLGTAKAVAQVTTAQVTAYDVATTYKLTVNGSVISVIAAGGVNATATALAAAWNLSTTPEFAEITASASTDTVTLTGDTLGKPFTVASSVTSGTGTIGAVSTTTAATGPNHFDATANWSGGTVPTGGDTVIFGNNVDMLYAIDQNATTFAEVRVEKRHTGKIGLPIRNSSGYTEYRETYFKCGATLLNIGVGQGQGSGRLKINVGSVASTVIVDGTGSPAEANVNSFLFVGTSASNVLTVNDGNVGVAIYGGETSNISGGFTQNGGTVVLSRGVTTATLTKNAGSLLCDKTITAAGTLSLKT